MAKKNIDTDGPRSFRWLHLSDFHFEALERWDRRATLQALIRHWRYCQELWIGNFLQAADPPVQAAIVSSD